ncbi:retron St85 family RNA-directed DNA polymerase [Chromobacterium phragmitis]|uniref:RNA-directed DNA polymerase n=1 Tax=Chromobacterium phragmitis TaxID=2202141 RepID=A0A344UHH0_9NEIS|nr:retron St85 family RNA-directed DNA polymerase [Chromobacterium phragmitis]AXE34718.1 RNA-directed DNA polymerase [Chromobacterium phragmitis]
MSIIKYLADQLLLSEEDIRLFIKKAPYKYKVFAIQKRNNHGERIIAQPAKELKSIQQMVLIEFLKELPIHSCAMAYRHGISIKDNAKVHSSNTYLLKMDFADFFHSIRPEDLIEHYEKYKAKLSADDRVSLKKIFFWASRKPPEIKLSIGAPSSPFISNTILFDFDSIVSKVCIAHEITYTRYADDLTFTTNIRDTLFDIPNLIARVIKDIDYPRLKINHTKTVFSSKRSNRHVTGLVLTNENQISIGRSMKRKIKTMIFLYSKKNLSPDDIKFLRGYLSHIHNVEPTFLHSLTKKFGTRIVTSIFHQ